MTKKPSLKHKFYASVSVFSADSCSFESATSLSISIPKYEQKIVNIRSKRLIAYDNVGSILFNIPEISIFTPFNIKILPFYFLRNIVAINCYRNILTQSPNKSNTIFLFLLYPISESCSTSELSVEAARVVLSAATAVVSAGVS